jgi:hypothetical protein
VLNAGWLQRGLLVLSIITCGYLFMLTRSPDRGEALVRLLLGDS